MARGSSKNISQDLIDKILKDFESKKMSEKEIANRYNLNVASIFRLKNKYRNKNQINNGLGYSSDNSSTEEEKINLQEQEFNDFLYEIVENKYPDESVIYNIMDMCEAGCTLKDICEKHNLSEEEATTIINDFELSVNNEEQQQKEEEEKEMENKETNYITTFSKDDHILNFGLVKNRHAEIDKLVKGYIFNHVSDSDMFNYQKLDNAVNHFIDDNIVFLEEDNGQIVSVGELVVYVTGLSCCLASVIKVCAQRRVNLSLMHYNVESKDYSKQVIFNKNNQTIMDKLFPAYDKIHFHNCELGDILIKGYYFVITVDLNKSREYHVFEAFENIWQLYSELTSKLYNTIGEMHVAAFSVMIENNLASSKEICRGSNQISEDTINI